MVCLETSQEGQAGFAEVRTQKKGAEDCEGSRLKRDTGPGDVRHPKGGSRRVYLHLPAAPDCYDSQIVDWLSIRGYDKPVRLDFSAQGKLTASLGRKVTGLGHQLLDSGAAAKSRACLLERPISSSGMLRYEVQAMTHCSTHDWISAFCVLAIATCWISVSDAAELDIFPGDSFETAVENLNPGDTLTVHDGTYIDSGRISIGVKGTAASPVIIKAAAGEQRPLITRTVGDTPQNTINIEGAEYVTIRGLEISSNGGDGINMSGSPSYITLEDLVIHDISVGINFRSSMRYITARRNHIYSTNDTAEGMYVGCNNAACAVSNSIIEQNWIHDTRGSQGDGIEIKYGSWGNIIRDNVIHDTNYPCILAYGVMDANIDRPNIIEGNVVWNCGQAIDVIADAIVRNNKVIGTRENQSHVQVPVMRNVTIVNNTVIGSMPLRGWGVGNIPGSLSVANNVLYGGSITNQPSAATYSSNRQYSSGTSGIFVDPDNRDYWPAPESPLIGAADAAQTPSTDFNGTIRQAPFDVGAYESDGLASNPGWSIQAGFKVGGNADVVTPSPPTGLIAQ